MTDPEEIRMVAFGAFTAAVLIVIGVIAACGKAPPNDVEGERRPINPSGPAPRA